MVNIKRHPSGCIGILLTILTLVLPSNIRAQLKINDRCPDVSFSDVINYKEPVLKLSDLDGKAVIIDFWSTKCLSCLQNFPTIDSLQRDYRNDVQILLVTKESRKTVEDFFKRFIKIKLPAVPIIMGDTTLSSLFPSEGYPYTVWIDRGRKVKHLTGGYNTTASHLNQFLKGDSLSLKYSAIKTKYAPLWSVKDSVFGNNLQYFSAITHCINGVDIGGGDRRKINNGKSSELTCNCCTVLELFKKAYREYDKYPVDTKYGLELQTKNSNEFFIPEDKSKWDEWQQQNTYNYQLVLPALKSPSLYKTMQEDLRKGFDLTAIRIKKKVKGYELIQLDKHKMTTSTGGHPKDAYNDGTYNDSEILEFVNQPIDRLSFLIRYWLEYNFPVRISTKQKSTIDFYIRKVAVETCNIAMIREDLRRSNFDLKEVLLETDVLILK